MVGFLLDHGVTTNTLDRNGDPLLTLAVLSENDGVIDALIKHGANLNPSG